MKVCLDIQSAVGKRTGVGRYTIKLAESLIANKGEDSIILFAFDFLGRGSHLPLFQGATKKLIRWCPGRVARLCWKTFNYPSFNVFAGNADVYHFPNFILPPLKKRKSIVTIHDLSFLRYPQFTERKNLTYLTSRIHDTVTRADLIITDSNYIGEELQEYLKVPPDRIVVIYPGISEEFKHLSPDEISAMSERGHRKMDCPYLLTVGTIEPRKNLEFMIELFENMPEFDGKLVIAGMLGWKYEPVLQRIARSTRREHIALLGYVDDKMLPALYSGAQLFLCCSYYEGFGFPPLEAMACGTPVVSSTGGSLSEVLENGAVLIDKFDIEQWKHEINQLLNDLEWRTKVIARGYQCVTRYSWTQTAVHMWQTYRRFK